jgi:hypothetical protein
METKAKIITTLEKLKDFFEKHNEIAWRQRTNNAIQEIQAGQDLRSVLYDFVGVGMGSLIDLYICASNGHLLTETEKETNRKLEMLSTEILTIEQALR